MSSEIPAKCEPTRVLEALKEFANDVMCDQCFLVRSQQGKRLRSWSAWLVVGEKRRIWRV